MTIKIKKLAIEKDYTEVVRGEKYKKHTYLDLQGCLKVSLSEGTVVGESSVDIQTVSKELQDELYKVLNKIEDELNGVVIDTKKYSWDSTKESEVAKVLDDHFDKCMEKIAKIDAEENITVIGDSTGGIIKGTKLANISPEEVILSPEEAKKLLKTPKIPDSYIINITVNGKENLGNVSNFAENLVQQIKKHNGSI